MGFGADPTPAAGGDQVRVAVTDSTSSYLEDALVAGADITLTVLNPGADESISVALGAHASNHTDGSDDIRDATDALTGLATATQITKLDGIEALADVTGLKNIGVSHTNSDTAVDVADGLVGVAVPIELNGYTISDVCAAVYEKGVTGATDVQVRRRRAGASVDVLSTKVTLGDEFFARDGTVDAANDDLATGDLIFVDVDAVHTTPPEGLSVVISCTKP